MARVDVMLQAAVAAVEQVQDVRIDVLESPQANYLPFVVEVLVTIAFETTLAGVVLSKMSGALFSHIMASVALRVRLAARAKSWLHPTRVACANARGDFSFFATCRGFEAAHKERRQSTS